MMLLQLCSIFSDSLRGQDTLLQQQWQDEEERMLQSSATAAVLQIWHKATLLVILEAGEEPVTSSASRWHPVS